MSDLVGDPDWFSGAKAHLLLKLKSWFIDHFDYYVYQFCNILLHSEI